MTTTNLFSILAILFVFTAAFSGAVGTVAASPSDVQFQQETPTTTPQANNSSNNSTTTSTATPSDDFADSNDSDDSDVQVESGGESDSSNDSNFTAAGDDEPPFNTSNPDYDFSSGLLLKQDGHGDNNVTFTVYNPTDSEIGFVWFNGNDEGKGYYLDAGEAKTLTVPTSGNILGQSAVVSTEVADVESFNGNIQYSVGYTPLVINWNPAGDLGPVIAIVGALVIITLFLAVMKLNMRVGKIAIPLAGQSLRGVYADEDTPNRDDPYSKQAKDMIHGWGLLAIVGFNWAIGVLAFWDLYPLAWFWKLVSGFGRLYDPSTLVTIAEIWSNLMVYWGYVTFLFIAVVWMIGRYYLRRNGYYLHDIDPTIGDLDYAPWLLSPSRYADLRVYKRLSKSESSPTQIVEITKKRLKEINQNTSRTSYVVSHYDPKENICFVTMEEVDPSKLSRSGKLSEVAEYYRSMYQVLSDEVWHWAKKWGRQLKAIDSARIEGELMEGAHNKDEWMRQDLSETDHEEIVTGKKTVEQDLEEQLGEVDGLTDQNPESDGSSQTAGDAS